MTYHSLCICFRFLFVPVCTLGSYVNPHPGRARKNSLFGISSAMLFLTRSNDIKEPHPMEWTTPKHEEIDLNCEISSYANAEL